MAKKLKKYIAFFLFFLLFFSAERKVFAATTYYIDGNSGNDASPGTQSQPWKTISKAAGIASAGDTVYVRGGIYQEKVYLSRSGTAAAPIKVMAYPGETPVIDGNNYTIATNWGVLLYLLGDFVQVSGFEVRYSGGLGVQISGKNDLASNLNVHHSFYNGVLITGDYGIVENSQVWSNCMTNVNGSQSSWPSGLSAARSPNNAIIRKNIVYYNWGEGLSTYEANGTIIEDNVIYENWALNAYISDASNVLFQRNLIYNDGSVMTSGGRTGIAIGNEKWSNPSSNIKVINNLVLGTRRSFYWFYQYGYLKDVLIAYNTFINSVGTDIPNLQFSSGTHQNVRVENNIIQQDGPLPIAIIGASTGLTFSNNLWSKTPPSSAAGPGDVISDPRLAKTGSIQAGALTADWFRLLADSPAIDRAKVISEVQEDYFKIPRGTKPDIGAHEYQGTILPTNTPLPTSIPTSTPTQTLSPTPVPFCQTCLFGVPLKSDGNANCDSMVDLSDYTTWLGVYRKVINNQSTTEQEKSLVDFNCQPSDTTHTIGLDDYAIWLRTYRTSLGG